MRRRYFLQQKFDPSEQEEEIKSLKQEYAISLLAVCCTGSDNASATSSPWR